MDQYGSTIPPKKSVRIAFNKRVNAQFGLEPVYKYRSIFQIGKYKPEGYECTIYVGNRFIRTNKSYKSKIEAASQTAKLGYRELAQPGSDPNDESTPVKKRRKNKIKKIEKAEVGWIHAKHVENVYKNLSEDILAMQFRDILEQHWISEGKRRTVYKTQLHTDGGITGYSTTLDYNEKTYKSLGLMLSEEHAEQSAAEICLRDIGVLPSFKTPDMFVIQPYEGGSARKIKGADPEEIIPHMFVTTAFSDMLRVYLSCHYMQSPRYYTKKLQTQPEEAEIGADGKAQKMVECICCFEGKVFEAKYPQLMLIGKELAAAEALKHLGISNPVEKLELRKIACVHRYDFLAQSSLSPFHQSPSKQIGWTSRRFCRDENYDDSTTEMLFSSGILAPYISGNDVYMQDLVSKELSTDPSFKNETLFTIKDLTIADVDPNNPNVFLIGNSEFSIKMLCEDGKIFSKNRDSDVKLLPGHNILELNCHYKVTLPSLEVYLKGVDCDDVTFPNPTIPVVTSCGTVVLFHDYEASRSDIYVILRKRLTSSSFEQASGNVRLLLMKLLSPITYVKSASPEQCVEGIKSWEDTDVKLLSEMTMDSMQAFISKCQQYDDRWNELFARKTLPDELKELQDLCLKEIERRKDEGHEEAVVVVEPWTLPESEFISRFQSVGINLEASNECAFRALLESDGNIRVKLGDIDNSPTVDLPVENEGKQHRGDIMRYYIWKGCQKVPGNEKVTYFDQVHTEGGWKLAPQSVYCSFSESNRKLLKDEHPHGFKDEREAYFKGVYYDCADIYGDCEPNEDGASAENGENSGDQDKIIATMDVDEEKEVQNDADEEVDEAKAVDEAITDEYGTIGETADMANGKADESMEDGEAKKDDNDVVMKEEKMRNRGDRTYQRGLDVPDVRRKALREHCVWMKLHEAVDVCPTLKRISVTPQFQNQIKLLIDEANSFMESKGMNEKIETSVLLDDEECTD